MLNRDESRQHLLQKCGSKVDLNCFKNGLNRQGSAVDPECQAWAACTDSLTCKMMSEWAQSDVKESGLLITQKMVTQKIQELLSTLPILHVKTVKNILDWVGIEPGSSVLMVFDLSTEPQR